MANIPADLLRKYSQVFPAGTAGGRMRDILVRRRRAHLEALDSLFAVAGVPREPGSENIWMMNGLRIFQEPAVIHLTGINQPGVILLLDPSARGAGREILFIAGKDPKKEFWDGVRLGYPPDPGAGRQDLEDIRALTGIQDIRPLADFDACFRARARAARKAYGYAFFHDYGERGGKRLATTTDHNWAFKTRLEALARKERPGFAIRSWAEGHFRLRLPLEPDQVRDVAKAVAITGAAFRETMAALPGFKDENEVAAHLEYGMRRRSPFGLSFPTISASGRNATVLHYLKDDAPLDRGGLLLLDFGARWGTMHADVTRTIPVTGRFDPLQALLYGIVLRANENTLKRARPGATIRELNRLAWEDIEDGLRAEFFARGGKAIRAYESQPHGLSHLMGEQEHDGDPHRLYQDRPLQPGWQISNEPGLYGHFAIRLGGRSHSGWIGIRIEDDLLITPKGARNLTAAIPKSIPALEALIGAAGAGSGSGALRNRQATRAGTRAGRRQAP